MKKTILKSALIVVAGVGLIAGNAFALPVLTITDGDNTMTFDDSVASYGAGDAIGDGVIGYFGSIGGTELSFSAGSSYPALGAFNYPEMHLGAGIVLGDAEITFTLTETFTSIDSNITGWIIGMGGYGSGNVTFEAFLNGQSLAFFDNVSTATQISNYIPTASSYDFKLVGTIQGAGTSFDAGVSPIPEPATMLLFGAGLATLAGFSRKKSQKKA